MTEKRRKHRRRSKRHERSFLNHFWFEILIAFLFLFGVFLLFEDMELKSMIFHGVLGIFRGISNAFSSFLSAILGGLTVIETSDIVGTILIIIALILLAFRARQKAIERYGELTSCPECNGDLIHIHRNRLQRITSTLLRLKIRRYRCKECSFEGLRIRSKNAR